MNHLVLEWPFYTSFFLIIWMKESDDRILIELFKDSRIYNHSTVVFF
jgi:hypothetical protein